MLRRSQLPSFAIRIFQLSFFLLLLLLFMLPWKAGQATLSEQQDQLLQLSAAGHVLGFQKNGIYVAAANHMLHMQFVDANGVPPKSLEGQKRDDETSQLAAVTYIDLWPGINLRYESVDHGITMSTWEILPGADPEQIRLRYNSPVNIQSDGSLKIDYETGWMKESAPIAWQEIDGHQRSVDVAFHLLETQANEAVVGFKVGHYEPDHPLLIDPTMTWNTFMGSTGDDYGGAIAVDESGNVYVAGSSEASWGTPVNAFSGGMSLVSDAFVAKLDQNGVLIWNTFMGSANRDYATGIAVDVNGNVYVTGASDGTWGGTDAFIVKLDVNGVRKWYRFLGAAGVDRGVDLTIDGDSNIYVAGTSDTTWGTPVNAHMGNNDAFIAKLNRNGVLIWNTFMGSTADDYGSGIAVDESGNVYVAGHGDASWGMPVTAYIGKRDAFAAKLNANGNRIWHTFMGSTLNDYGISIAVDDVGNSYVSGRSVADWGFPVNAYMGGDDAFAAKLDTDGNRMWNTFMGSKNYDYGGYVTLDDDGNLYVGGYSDSSWGKPINSFGGGSDAFAAHLNSEGVLIWNLFLGSDQYDYGSPITVDNDGNIYMTGNSTASWGSPVNDYTGGRDAFVTKPRTTGCTLIIFKKKSGKSIPMCL
jgi:hypothetical protein